MKRQDITEILEKMPNLNSNDIFNIFRSKNMLYAKNNYLYSAAIDEILEFSNDTPMSHIVFTIDNRKINKIAIQFCKQSNLELAALSKKYEDNKMSHTILKEIYYKAKEISVEAGYILDNALLNMNNRDMVHLISKETTALMKDTAAKITVLE